LLEKHVNLNTEGSIYGSTVQAKSAVGLREAAQDLLTCGVDMDRMGWKYHLARQEAYRRVKVVDLLLAHGAIETRPPVEVSNTDSSA
jgi:hypothetical protein